MKHSVLSYLRTAAAVTLISAAAAMAFVASGDRLVTVGNGSQQDRAVTIKIAGHPDAAFAEFRSARAMPGEGPAGGYEAYKSAARTYPANVIPPSMVRNAKDTFNKIVQDTFNNMITTQSGANSNPLWQSYGPLQSSIEPGVLAFSGATDTTASRDTALVVAPKCVPGNCRLWVGEATSGIWRTDDALANHPQWRYLSGSFDINSVGAITFDPADPTGNTLWVGTGEANACRSGCVQSPPRALTRSPGSVLACCFFLDWHDRSRRVVFHCFWL